MRNEPVCDKDDICLVQTVQSFSWPSNNFKILKSPLHILDFLYIGSLCLDEN